MLRIDRGLSKQHLARHAGTSRQQLWRVMTGKSELTSSLCQRLAEVFQVDARALRSGDTSTGNALVYETAASVAAASPSPADVGEYLADPAHVRRTLATLPGGESGERLKRAFLVEVERIAHELGAALSPDLRPVSRASGTTAAR